MLRKIFVLLLLAGIASAHHAYSNPYADYSPGVARYYASSAFADRSQYGSVATYNALSSVTPNTQLTPVFERDYYPPIYYATPIPRVALAVAPPLQLPPGKAFPLYKGAYNRWYYSPYEGYGATQPASPDNPPIVHANIALRAQHGGVAYPIVFVG